MEKAGEERTLGLQTILEVEPGEGLLHSSGVPESSPKVTRLRTWGFDKLAFGVMLIGGLTLLWIYSRLSQSLSPQSLAMLQQTVSRVGFADSQKIALMAFCALIIALFARRPTNRMGSRLLSTARVFVIAHSRHKQTDKDLPVKSLRGSPGEIRTPVSR